LPTSLTLRLLTYQVAGFRPLRLLTNVLSAQDVPYACWWGLNPEKHGLRNNATAPKPSLPFACPVCGL